MSTVQLVQAGSHVPSQLLTDIPCMSGRQITAPTLTCMCTARPATTAAPQHNSNSSQELGKKTRTS